MPRKRPQKPQEQPSGDPTPATVTEGELLPEPIGPLPDHPAAEYIAKSDGSRTDPERKATIYNCADYLKMSSGEIARRLSMDKRTVDAILQTRDSTTLSVTNYLDAHALEAADQWVKAMREGARKGKHGPAKDLLLHRKHIEPIQENQTNVQVAIVVGAPGQPLQLQPPQVIDSKVDSD